MDPIYKQPKISNLAISTILLFL